MKTTFNISGLIRPNVLAMKSYSSARDEFHSETSEMIFLDANENPFPRELNRYPDPKQVKLKAILSAMNSIETDNILLGNGSDEVLDLLFRAFCNPGKDNVITLPPTYGMYSVLAALNEVEDRQVLLTRYFQPDVEAILGQADDNSKLLFLCSPNNPTGNSFSKSAVELLLQNFPGLVVIDEAYIDFAEGSGWLESLQDFPNLVITQTMSKAYGMAAIRLGICYASSEIIQVLNKIKPPYNVNLLTQLKASERLGEQLLIKDIEEIRAQRKILTEALKGLDFVKKIYPSEANFILVEVDDAALRYNQLLDQGIVVRNRSSQPLCENTLRISIGTTSETTKLIQLLNSLP